MKELLFNLYHAVCAIIIVAMIYFFEWWGFLLVILFYGFYMALIS